jgi:hypothetical protein
MLFLPRTERVNHVLRELVEPYPWLEFREPWFHIQHRNRQWLDAWNRMCQQAAQSGNAEELHAVRDDYEAVLRGQLKILDGWLLVWGRLNGESHLFELPERLTDTRDSLQRHYDSLFPRWQALEDLEAIILETISPTHGYLKDLATIHSPPQSWYHDPSAPLASEE